MTNISKNKSAWVSSALTLACFGPVTLLWFVAMRALMTWDDLPVDVFVAAGLATLGPVGLLCSLVAAFTSKQSGRFAVVLACAFGLIACVQLLDLLTPARLSLAWFETDWSVIALYSVLPLLGCVQLWKRSETRTLGPQQPGWRQAVSHGDVM